MAYDVSIIVPIYKAEEYIKKCATSLFEQDFASIEYIFIDDCSPDSSIQQLQDVIETYPNRREDTKIIRNKSNLGSGATRGVGMGYATGEYVIQIDADDWIEPNMIRLLYQKAKKEKADIVCCDYYLESMSHSDVVSFIIPSDKYKAVNTFAIMPTYMNYFWNKLVRRGLYLENNIDFPNGVSLGDDLYVTFKLVFLANKVVQINQPLYHYNQLNTHSITSNHTLKSFEDKLIVNNEVILFLQQQSADKEYQNLIHFYKIYSKLLLILNKHMRDDTLWRDTYPESNAYIWQVPLRFDYKLLSWLCSHNQFTVAYLLQDIKAAFKK
ncbi:glycosyltransferase family 2 protein [Psychrobacter celer]|uniref:glycosyltransferase family 2 protein n=1 Tax=Psychrobacter celer TaxID=306572 RepID=UPI003FD3291C